MSAADTAYAEIEEGSEHTQEYTISEAVYRSFLQGFDDRSPIHVDDEYARARGFHQRVMHGAILNGFVSHFVGMRFPGRRALLMSVDLRYARPCYLEDRIRVRATVAQKVDSQSVIVLKLELENLTRGEVVARGVAQVKVSAA